jgi:asparagine synthase (glutamine-hydrolysing)
VILSGEGGDELFAGYPTYIGHRLADRFARLPAPARRLAGAILRRALPVSMGNVGTDYLVRRFLGGADLPRLERHVVWFGSLPPERLPDVVTPEVALAWRGDDPFASFRSVVAGRSLPDSLAELLYLDFSLYLQDDLLTKVDRATMLASVEARGPFLDHELAEFVAGLPSRLKLSGTTTKAVLRRAMRDRLPAEVLGRRKRGFNIPFSRWLLEGLGDRLRERFAPDRVAARGLLSAAGVSRLLDEHLSRRVDHRKPLYTLLALDMWCDRTYGAGAPVPIAARTSAATPLQAAPR